MDQTSELFSEDYERLQDKIRHYPAITIRSIEKDPPEQYVIEYRLFGYAYDAEGNVQMGRKHRIELNLPFGYPHFPPTVRPLTRICHPDVDEQAVRIADYWQSNPSLADLVVHIAHMIRGEVFSASGAFNQEAAEWYAQNMEKLPLAELEYINDPDNILSGDGGSSGIPYRLIAGVLICILAAGGGWLLYRDKQLLAENDSRYKQMEKLITERQFLQAKDAGAEALASLKRTVILGSARDDRVARFQELLESRILREGLQGRVEYKGDYVAINLADAFRKVEQLLEHADALLQAGDLAGAKGVFTEAADLAADSGLDATASEVRRVAARKRLNAYLNRANVGYSEKKWQESAGLYQEAVALITAERQYLSSDAVASLEKVETLRILALANALGENAENAEKKNDFNISIEHYKAIVLLISSSPYVADPVLSQRLSESQRQVERVQERAFISAGTEYLLENFKEIFKKHYPGVHGPALQSPRVKFIRRSGGNLVFLMSCIELIKRNSNEFLLYYQYDPVLNSWSIYRERK
jgi:ubiquitin-protein ligase